MLVQRFVIEAGRPDLALHALHHDSHEAYAGDIPTPVKIQGDLRGSSRYCALCDDLDRAIRRRFGLATLPAADEQVIIKRADRRAVLTEAHVLLFDKGDAIREAMRDEGVDLASLGPLSPVEPLSSQDAFHAFLASHARYAEPQPVA